MKRKFYLLFTALLMMATTSAWAYDYNFIEDGIAYKINSDGTSVTVTYGTSDLPWNLQENDFYSGDITIPATVNHEGTTYDVTEIGREAFRFSKITSITFKEGSKVTTIGKAAFNRCSELTQITIPSSVTTIAGDGVFGYCAKLTKINIGSGVTSIGDNFMYGSPVSSMYVYTSSVPSTNSYYFSGSSPIIHVYPALADDFNAASPWKDAGTIVGDIGTGSTYKDTTRVKIGELYYNLTSAGTATVTYSTEERPWNLHAADNSYKNPYTGDITIPKTVTFDGDTYDVTAIGQEAFRYATITSITFSEDSKVTSFGLAAFNNCDELTEITIPNSVTTIAADGCIAYCDNLKKITIGSGVTSIGDQFTYGSPIDTVIIYTRTVPSGPSNMFSGNRPNRVIHVYHDMVDAFKSASSWSNFATYIGDLDEATLNYKIGDRKKLLSDLHNGDLVYIQAASSSLYYDSFIQETSDGQYRWDKGLNNNCVWKLISTGTSNQYYFKNVVSGKYMAGTNTEPTLSETTADNCKIDVYDHWTYGYVAYDAAEKPRGWDMYFFELQHHNDWWLGNDGNNHLNDRLFPNDGGIHNIQWNFYEAVIDEGTGETLNPGKILTDVSEIKLNRAYTLLSNQSAIEVKADYSTAIATSNDNSSTTTGSVEVGFNQWVFVPTGNVADYYYLYNVASKKYIKADNSDQNELTENEPLTMKVSTVTDNGTTYFLIEPQNNGTRTHFGIWNVGVYINGGLGTDGTYITVAEAAIFEPSAVTDVTVPSFTLVDKVDYTPPTYSFTATSATYTRDMKSGVKWGTVMLPYAVSATSDVKFYEITNLTNDELTVTETTNGLTAGTPALFKRTNTSSSTITFSANDVEVVPDVNDATSGTITLKGVYAADKITDAYYIANDKFWSGSFHIYPFRAYLTGSAASNAFSILVDDDPTGITTAATTADASDEIEGVYSVSGVKLSDLQKGINIIRYRSGKTQKVILK